MSNFIEEVNERWSSRLCICAKQREEIQNNRIDAIGYLPILKGLDFPVNLKPEVSR